jgi:hypothetical protein
MRTHEPRYARPRVTAAGQVGRDSIRVLWVRAGVLRVQVKVLLVGPGAGHGDRRVGGLDPELLEDLARQLAAGDERGHLAPAAAGALQDVGLKGASFILTSRSEVVFGGLAGGLRWWRGARGGAFRRLAQPLPWLVADACLDFSLQASLAEGRSADAEPRLHLLTGDPARLKQPLLEALGLGREAQPSNAD